VRSYPEVIKVYSTVETDEASVYIKMVDKTERDRTLKEVLADMRQKLKNIPGIRVSMLFNQGLTDEKGWEFRLQGYDLEQMQVYAEKAQRIMESIPGVVDVSSSYKPGKPEMKLVVKNREAADLGVSTAQIAQTIHTMFTGTVVSQFSEGEDRYDVRLRLGGTQRQDVSDLNNIYLPGSNGTAGNPIPLIALSQVTEPIYSTAPNTINRFDRYKEIVLSGNLDSISLGDFNKTFQERAQNEIKMPPEYRFYAGGDSERMGETFTSMIMALFIGIMFIFFILASQFESYIDPFSIMLALPMAVIGAVYGLLIMGSELNLVSMIGIVMLMGLVSKNAILLIDFTKQARARGVARNEALKLAASTRLRPIMMTSMAMIFSMLPLALGLGSGAEMRAPMAYATIGGLITSTLLTLVVVPVIYSLLDDFKNRMGNKKNIAS
jgi:multidrug efflux pump subunit AcrB